MECSPSAEKLPLGEPCRVSSIVATLNNDDRMERLERRSKSPPVSRATPGARSRRRGRLDGQVPGSLLGTFVVGSWNGRRARGAQGYRLDRTFLYIIVPAGSVHGGNGGRPPRSRSRAADGRLRSRECVARGVQHRDADGRRASSVVCVDRCVVWCISEIAAIIIPPPH